MDNKTAVITGGGRGIGAATALFLAQSGWDVAICYRSSQTEAESVIDQVHATGRRGMSVRCDVSDAHAASAFITKVESELGRIDALINCAGPYHRIPLFEESLEGWHSMFDNNLHPVFYLSRAVAAGMQKRRWGRIINFSMANADRLLSQPNLTAHYIAKVGVLVLTRTLAKMLASDNITVNAISPGFIDSGSLSAEELAQMQGKIPAGYVGTTDDAVAVISFLLSEEARYINGANLHLSGGWGI